MKKSTTILNNDEMSNLKGGGKVAFSCLPKQKISAKTPFLFPVKFNIHDFPSYVLEIKCP